MYSCTNERYNENFISSRTSLWLIVGEFNILFKVPVGVSTQTMIPNEDIVCIYHGPNRSDHYGATLFLWTL